MKPLMNLKKYNLKTLIVFAIISFVILPLIVSFLCIYRANNNEMIKRQDEAVYLGMLANKNAIEARLSEINSVSAEIVSNNLNQNVVNRYFEERKNSYEIAKYRLTFYLRNILASQGILAGYYVSDGKNIIYQYNYDTIKYEDIDMTNFKPEEINFCLSRQKEEQSINKTNIDLISVIRYKKESRFSKNVYFRFSVDEANFRETHEKSLYGDSISFVIDENNMVLSSTEADTIGRKSSYVNLLEKININSSKRVNIQGKNFLMLKYGIDYAPWQLIYLIPLSSAASQNIKLGVIIIFSFLICIALGLTFYILLDRYIVRPINKLSSNIISFGQSKNNNQFQISDDGSIENPDKNELIFLSKSFEDMVIRIDDLIEKVYKSGIREKEAELKALESQINPHFLYNTLDSIRWKAVINKDKEVSEQIEILSNIFRHVLNKGNNITTLGDEINYVKNYIYIQQLRFGDKISYELNCDESLYKKRTLKLILQPLVENAVTHGHGDRVQKGKIIINIFRDNDNMIYEVIDDGDGADENYVNSIISGVSSESGSFALKTTSNRLTIKFGAEYALEFKSKVGEGTCVRAKIPWEFDEK